MPKLMLRFHRLGSSLRFRLRAICRPVSSPKPPVLPRATFVAPETREIEDNILRSLHTTLDYMQGDLTGTWTCCSCNTKKDIVVTSGEQPLGRLSCTKCKHVWCRDCNTQKIGLLTELPQTGVLWVLPHWSSELYVALCTECGLTRRLRDRPSESEGPTCIGLELSDLECECAASIGAKSKWVALKVGTGSNKLDDPQKVLQQIKEVFDDGYIIQPPVPTLVAQTFFDVPSSFLKQ